MAVILINLNIRHVHGQSFGHVNNKREVDLTGSKIFFRSS